MRNSRTTGTRSAHSLGSSLTRRMDDVEDNSELRRGEPVAHTIYGVPQTINTANYVYFQAIQELLKLQHGHTGSSGSEKGKGKEGDLIGLVTGSFQL